MNASDRFEALVVAAATDGVQQLVVGAVVEHEGRVLLLQRPSDDFMGGIWELPSGKVEAGESLDAALRREVLEETGLPIQTIGRYLGSFDYTSGSGRLSRQFNFAVDVDATRGVVLTEHDSYTWREATDDVPVTPDVKAVLAAHSAEL